MLIINKISKEVQLLFFDKLDKLLIRLMYLEVYISKNISLRKQGIIITTTQCSVKTSAVVRETNLISAKLTWLTCIASCIDKQRYERRSKLRFTDLTNPDSSKDRYPSNIWKACLYLNINTQSVL